MPTTSLDFLDRDQPWYKGRVSDALWDRLKARLTGGKDAAGIEYSSFVRLSSADADKIIAKMKKDPRGYPQVDQKGKDGGYYNLEAYQNWLVEEYLNSSEPPGLDEILKEIREEKKEVKKQKPTSSAIVPVGKKGTDLVEEKIDEKILAILGLQDVFDFTYEEYLSLLKEKAAEGRLTGSGDTDTTQLITDEFKRVKGKTGRFKVKATKISAEKVVSRKPGGAETKVQLDPKRLLPPAATQVEDKPEEEKIPNKILEELTESLKSINSVVSDILSILEEQINLEKKKTEKERIEGQKQKKKTRESELEGVSKKSKELVSKITKPFTNIFDMIKNFFLNILLGSAVNFLLSVLKNPSIILNPLKSFANQIIDFLNNVIAFIYNLVVAPINAVINGINAGINELVNQINRLSSLLGLPPISGSNLPTIPDPPQIPKFQFEGGGQVDKTTGLPITGLGPDTQLTALSPGEVVMSNKAGDFFGRDTLLAMNKMAGGTNQPGMGPFNIMTAAGGGMIPPLPPTNTIQGQHYGASRDGGARQHAGVDYDIGPNDKFFSRIGGIVTKVGTAQGYGNYVDIFNSVLGVYERIAEGQKVLVTQGQMVSPGHPITQGESKTGVIHYEIRSNPGFGISGTVNPAQFLASSSTQQKVANLNLASLKEPSGATFLPIPAPAPTTITSSATPNQPTVPTISPEDPMNMSVLVVKAMYNMVG